VCVPVETSCVEYLGPAIFFKYASAISGSFLYDFELQLVASIQPYEGSLGSQIVGDSLCVYSGDDSGHLVQVECRRCGADIPVIGSGLELR
jgi:hypothetical protein